MSLLQLGNRRNGPRTACRTPAFCTSPTRGSASPEGPPDSPSRRRASLSFRNGAPTTSPEGLRPNHRILRRARPRPAISMASTIQLCRPERQPGRCGRTNEALIERPPPSPIRTFERASRRTPALRHEPADPRPHLPDPKAHGTRTGSRETSRLPRVAPGHSPKGIAGCGSGHRRPSLGSVAETEIETSRSTSSSQGWTSDRPPRRGSEDPCLRRVEARVSRSMTSPLGLHRRHPKATATEIERRSPLGASGLDGIPKLSAPRPRRIVTPGAPKSQQARRSGAENLRAPGPVGARAPKGLDASSSEELSSLLPGESRTESMAVHQPESRLHTKVTNRGSALSRFQRRDLDLQRLRRDPASFRPLLARSQLELFIS